MRRAVWRVPLPMLCIFCGAAQRAAQPGEPPTAVEEVSLGVSAGGLFRAQYRVGDPSFCHASACVDVDNDGERDLFFASRGTKALSRLRAARRPGDLE